MQDFEKYRGLADLPPLPQALASKYSAFDPGTGDPTHDAAGVVLEGKALEKAKKDVEKQRKVGTKGFGGNEARWKETH
jgi:hypothetical protein